MGILNVLLQNLRHRPRTRAVADAVPRPAGFRGMIEHEASLCTGCTACAYVCAPQAISFERANGAAVTWKFSAGQCSFCGLCVQYCPTHAITNRGKLPAVGGDLSAYQVAHKVEYQPCAQCSRPIVPLAQPVLEALYTGQVTEAAREQQTLCEACRRRQTSTQIRNAFLGS
jgi:formate hydrogenlyase subunit 6/NADH:ubiquinone oxidoreductase subunit I